MPKDIKVIGLGVEYIIVRVHLMLSYIKWSLRFVVCAEELADLNPATIEIYMTVLNFDHIKVD